MNRLQPIESVQASGELKPDLLAVKRQFGVVANAIRVLGNSPAAMNGFLCLHTALSGGVLSTKIRAQIALAVSEINGCAYCLSAYTVSGRRAGLNSAEISAARFGSGARAFLHELISFSPWIFYRQRPRAPSLVTAPEEILRFCRIIAYAPFC